MKFIVVFMLLGIRVLCQENVKSPFPAHLVPAIERLPVSTMGLTLRPIQGHINANPSPQPMMRLPNPVSSDFYCNSLGFFCRQEWKVEKAIAIPFRFRLGSVAEVDRLEGKNFH